MSSSSFSRRSNPTEDIISGLPDEILCNILSFVPIKLAASTSILSKRWKSLFLSLVTLHFDDRTFPNFETFSEVVNSFMHSRDPTVRLQSFHLQSVRSYQFDQDDINRIVSLVVQTGIHSLKLTMCVLIRLPPSVLNCKTLTILNLNYLTVDNLPSVIDFPLLKTLVLVGVIFMRHIFLINLLSGCPSLEDLHSQGLSVMGSSFSEGKVQSLPNLIRANVSSNLDIPFNLLYKAHSLRLELMDLYFPHDFGFDNLTKLELVFASKLSGTLSKWKWSAELLNYCPKLQNLTLHEVYFYGSKLYDAWVDPKNVPECLSSQLRTCLFKKCRGTECELQFAKYIIQNSKVLHTMTIQSARDMKRKIFKKLSLCRKGSARCELVFD